MWIGRSPRPDYSGSFAGTGRADLPTAPACRCLLSADCEMTGLNAYLPPDDLKAGEAFLPDRILEVSRNSGGRDEQACSRGSEWLPRLTSGMD